MMPGSAEGLSTTAPAPSPNNTAVLRSAQLVMRESVSAPTTSAHFGLPAFDELVRDRQRVDETAARGLDRERRAAARTEARLQQRAAVGEHEIRR